MSKLSHFIFRRGSKLVVTVMQLQANGPLEKSPLIDNPYEDEIADLYRSGRRTTLGNMFGCKED